MKNKTRRLAAFLLSAAVVITAVPGMQERVYAQKTGGYTESPKSENVPVVKETKSRLKKAEAVPSAYMNKLSELTIRYPGVRDQGKYDTCWAFSAIGLAEFDLIADNQTACGKGNLDESLIGTEGYVQYEYVDKPLRHLFAAADLIISRAGANSICEILALRKPNILIPLSAAASRGDQILNANSFAKQGFSTVLEEEVLTADTLSQAIEETYKNRQQFIDKMSESHLNNAVKTIMGLIHDCTRS